MSGNYSFGVVGRTFDYYSIEYSSYDYYWIEYSFGVVTNLRKPGRGARRTDFRLPRLARYLEYIMCEWWIESLSVAWRNVPDFCVSAFVK